jgi:hypothetical protein
MLTYEQKLVENPDWAMDEGDRYFSQGGEAFKTLRRIIPRLEAIGVPYALVGGLALFRHGYRRYTDDVDLLVTPEGLRKIHAELEGLGYLAPFQGSSHLRDTVSNVRIEFLVTGQFPGDGKPKPVAFPDPSESAVDIDGMKVLNLPKLIDLKLASGLSNPRRGRDIIDVQELIETLKLPAEFAQRLDPSVREKFLDLHRLITETSDPYNKEAL